MGDVEIPETGVCEDGQKKGLKSDQSRKKRPSQFPRNQAQFIFSCVIVRAASRAIGYQPRRKLPT
jgi:hypothetical protein